MRKMYKQRIVALLVLILLFPSYQHALAADPTPLEAIDFIIKSYKGCMPIEGTNSSGNNYDLRGQITRNTKIFEIKYTLSEFNLYKVEMGLLKTERNTAVSFKDIQPNVRVTNGSSDTSEIHIQCNNPACITKKERVEYEGSMVSNENNKINSFSFIFCGTDMSSRVANALNFLIVSNGGSKSKF